LVVDDDMRTVFALSNLLSARGVTTLEAEHGARALEPLAAQPDVDLVLMVIMMPVLDDFETLRGIRPQDRFRDLPTIALTAKARKGDQEQCMAAGASGYLAEPVDQQELLSMLRGWLSR
jgi:CheY-like chemotaxis protein